MVEGPFIGAEPRPRSKKRPHTLHRCTTVEELIRALRKLDIDPVSLVSEFVKPSFDIGILITGSIPWGVATGVSDLDILALLPSGDALKKKRREIPGGVVKYLPSFAANMLEISLFVSGIEIDVLCIVNPAVASEVEPERIRDAAWLHEHHPGEDVLMRLATGWVVDGQRVVDRWKTHYQTDHLRSKWMAVEFTTATKDLEDMQAGIGLAAGHVAAIGAYAVMHLLHALMAYQGAYCTSVKWMLRIEQLIDTADPEMRQVLIRGRELAFPTLLQGVAEERAYVERVLDYCGVVRGILSRDEAMADLLASTIHDLDIIV
jgi:hypothetical protein